ncbi:hypothetical protein BN7_3011 [Wickerhamomyces ciferrii]|uniref:AMP-activated protein kinase glycogen-binding domain-containing protein n=1 Tax=Wickerhamomyces ciferrii (strain ATCC 14091 / BCRC 22168 / CBS 111 / JCM 3599 / NBRC 0793 / NRRL Y-1031 F-60-10) TaxID=1206466 RepID=K0KKG6_WICCF|nr:uncharacterized protein BN7_3011 [Wickerhamomyces ciferrii]CCH43461.1 hypothetical protein BN7_3011 [Wickerhamomyces ciferrii]
MRPKGPQEVILTGTFDSWSSSLPLVKTSKGDFEITLPLKKEQQQDDKVEFKFIVDGNWTTNDSYETIDDNGNLNNVIYLKNLVESNSKGSKIPEAGGLTAGIAGAVGAGAAALGLSSTSKDKDTSSKDVNTTVLPSQEGKQVQHQGEPGIAIPSNPHEISAFNEVRDVDAKELNAKLNNEKAEKSGEDLSKKEVKATVLPSNEGNHATIKGEPGIAIPSDPHQISAFNEVRNVDAKELNAKLNGEDKENDSNVFKTQVEPNQEGKHSTIKGEPGIVVPEKNGKDIEEFTQIRDVDSKKLNKDLNESKNEESEESKTKIVKVKKLIRRNKKTGEEVVISSTPLENDSKTLDPKNSTSNDKDSKDLDVKDTTGGASGVTKDSKPSITTTSKDKETKETKETETPKTTPKTSTTGTTGTNGSKPKPKPTTDSKIEKKPSLFRRVKKAFE